jgi:hypothetical protein
LQAGDALHCRSASTVTHALLFKRLLTRLWALKRTSCSWLRCGATAQRWQASLAPDEADSPAVPLGVVSGNRRTLYLEAARACTVVGGWHRLRKSGAAMTLIVSFAYVRVLAVLADFKGQRLFAL